MSSGKFKLGDDGELIEIVGEPKRKRKSKRRPLLPLAMILGSIVLVGIGIIGGVIVSRSTVALPTQNNVAVTPLSSASQPILL